MISVDTTVVVAAFAQWHESHAAARRALGRRPYLPAHAAVESYSTLTRLPDPFRAPPKVVAEFLRRRFGERWLHPRAETLRVLPDRLADLAITGGASYDALVGLTAADHGATLHTLDRRAERIYTLLGIDYELVS